MPNTLISTCKPKFVALTVEQLPSTIVLILTLSVDFCDAQMMKTTYTASTTPMSTAAMEHRLFHCGTLALLESLVFSSNKFDSFRRGFRRSFFNCIHLTVFFAGATTRFSVILLVGTSSIALKHVVSFFFFSKNKCSYSTKFSNWAIRSF